MAKFEIAIPHVLAWEGGYVNHPADPGGETNKGITDRLDGKIDGKVDLDGDGYGDVDIKSLTVDQAKEVYKRRFWDKMRGDEIESQAIAEILFDGYVNMGANAIKMIQNLVGVQQDGQIGPKTIEAINGSDELWLYTEYRNERKKFYINLANRKPQLQVFLKGWLNRIESFKDFDL